MVTKGEIKETYMQIQDEICSGLESVDGKAKFVEDLWERPGGGGGRTRIIQHGNVIEKGGVNFSAVHGKLPDNIIRALGVQKPDFFATGVSIVIHPSNPFVPIMHMNIRYFEIEGETWWFGGGIDMTPHYVDEKLAGKFHQGLKNICDKYAPDYYPNFKKWADDYFYIDHRNETRGVGGIFYDRLNEGLSKEEIFNFSCELGRHFPVAYGEQADAFRDTPYTEENKKWQMIRRGRYVEFNLVYDKGTKFGLQTSGRIESILMSLPGNASWYYNHEPEPGSREAKSLEGFRKDIDWVGKA